MVSSFLDDIKNRSVAEWSESKNLKVSYKPIIIPYIKALSGEGAVREHDYKFAMSNRYFEYAVDSAADFKLTLQNYNNNVTNKLNFHTQSANYQGYSLHGVITAKGVQDITPLQWEKSVNTWLSNLMIQYDRESYLGAINMGLISGITPNTTDFVFTNAEQMADKLITFAKDFNTKNSKGAFTPCYVMLSGVCADLYRTSASTLNNVNIRERLAQAGVNVELIDPLISTQDRADFVEFEGLTADIGLTPQVVSPLEKVNQVGVNGGILQLFVGYQSMAVHRLNDNIVVSYTKAP